MQVSRFWRMKKSLYRMEATINEENDATIVERKPVNSDTPSRDVVDDKTPAVSKVDAA